MSPPFVQPIFSIGEESGEGLPVEANGVAWATEADPHNTTAAVAATAITSFCIPYFLSWLRKLQRWKKVGLGSFASNHRKIIGSPGGNSP
jgi:hypothetical protein